MSLLFIFLITLFSDIKACALPSAGGTTANPYVLTRDKYRQKCMESVKK